ncbi:hypothetical protein M3Y97_00039000 [Aphelenchoides bicaudatus]|nr:hypothetical protein M3Y97_00039000 [Aphelenchoides bicaudatus]
MFSKRVVCVLVIACLAVEVVMACAPTSTSATGSSAAAASTTAAAGGRKRRDVSGIIEIHSSVPVNNVGLLLHKLQAAAANVDVDASKHANAEHEISAASDGTAIVKLNLPTVSDCAELRRDTSKTVKQVPEVTSTSVSCGGQHFNL